MPLYFIILLPILIGLLVYVTHTKYFKPIAACFQWLMLAGAFYIFYIIDVIHQRPVIENLGYYNDDISIHLYADSISALFIVITAFLFLMAIYYIYHKPYVNHLFIFLLLMLEGLIVSTFLVQDLFSLYALIEVSTIVVSVLILFKKDDISLYDSIVYMFTNIVVMSFYLLGVGYIYKIFGTLDMLELGELVYEIDNPRALILPYAFIMTGIGLKSAVMPLFSWLPRAHGSHAAPYVISAILSGLYVKGSLYIFIRIQAIFGDVLGTHELFIALGFFTAMAAMFLALAQTDLKLLLAYSTISQIGLIIFGLSIGTGYGYYGSIYHIFNHAIFKFALFLIAGILIDSYGTREIAGIRGVYKRMPFIGSALVVAMLGITGAPLFNGSISKYMIQKGLYSHTLLEYALIIINIGTICYVFKLIHMLPGDSDIQPKFYKGQQVVIVILAVFCLVGGVLGHYLNNLFFDLHIEWHLSDYIEKTLIYLISVAVAYVLYRFVYKKSRYMTTINHIELSFNELMMAIVLFFSGMMVYLMATV